MVLADLALGLLNRSAQQLNVFFFSMPLKSILVLLTLLISFPYALHHYLVESDKFLYLSKRLSFHLYERENRTAYRKEIT